MQARGSAGSSGEDDASDTSLQLPDGQAASPVHPPLPDPSIKREASLRREDTASSRSIRPLTTRSTSSFGHTMVGHAMHHHSRHHSTLSNFSTMSETSLPWTTSDIGLNAISGVLNDPSKRFQSSTKASKADVPPAPHASIRRVKQSDFDDYLAHIAPVFERYKLNKLTDDSTGSVSGTDTPSSDGDALPAHLRQSSRNPYGRPQLVMSSESLASDYQRELPMMDSVPRVFFEESFSLDNPRTFDAVCEGADITGGSSGTGNSARSTILQEKLSYYLDIIEVHLLHEIENRSSSFFEALSNLQVLHQQTQDCVSQIHQLRQKMKSIQATECKPGLEVIRLQVRQRNLEKLYNTIATVKEICSTQPMIQELMGCGDYFGALGLIEETQNALRHAQDIQNVRAVVNFHDQLGEMKNVVREMIKLDFLSTLTSDLSDQMNSWASEHGKRAHKPVTQLSPEDSLKKSLEPSILGLMRTDTMSVALQSFRERMPSDVENILKRSHPLCDCSPENEGSLERKLKSMPFDAYFDMLRSVLATWLEVIRRLAIYHQLVLSLVDEYVERQAKNDDDWTEWRQNIERESADIVSSATELAHKQCGKLVGFRSSNNAQLNSTDFYRLCSELRAFIQQSESFCGQQCSGLRGAVISQQRAFIDHFHMEHKMKETQLVENEQWMASDVPSDFQRIVDRICDGGISAFANSRDEPDTSNAESTKLLVVNGSKYYVVGCSLLILKMFEDYLRCISNLEDRVSDVLQKLVELIELFNSQVSKVILGAGAMRSAGLKNITAKHLALASQSLGAMISLIPPLQVCIQQHFVDKQTVLAHEFEKMDGMIETYKVHQGEIYAKLVGIMNDRFTVHITGMESIAWDEDTAPKSKYMETLVKETKTLHKVLKKYLPPDDLQSVMTRVFDSFTEQYSQKLPSLKISTEAGKARLSKDADYFIGELESLQDLQLPCKAIRETVAAVAPGTPATPT